MGGLLPNQEKVFSKGWRVLLCNFKFAKELGQWLIKKHIFTTQKQDKGISSRKLIVTKSTTSFDPSLNLTF